MERPIIESGHKYLESHSLGSVSIGGKATLCSKKSQAYHGFINHSTVINDNNYNSVSLDTVDLCLLCCLCDSKAACSISEIFLSKTKSSICLGPKE